MALEAILVEIRKGPAAHGRGTAWTAIHEVGHALVGRTLEIGPIIDPSLHDGDGASMLEHAINGDATPAIWQVPR